MSNNENRPEREIEDDALWDLLGKANSPSVSPFFSRNVVREVRQRKPSWARFFSRRLRFIPATAALGLLFCISVDQVMQYSTSSTDTRTASADKVDYEVITNLDDLLASQESSVWLDDSNQ